ncbi:Flp family type IVb pilin [Candidatus Liberibacter brunswickensis]|uniref:Flp family type IVb pilin n=1 Tax=Candidatus Liberibacter brunswickensis TaxID=1968796 RepID=UPI002FDFB16F
MVSYFKTFLKDNSGATAIEYGLLASLVALAIIGAVTSLGGKLNEVFSSIAGKLPTPNKA